ncbi:AraC family transcriptional regulator [Salmonella enterica subsp. enterica serovar Oranienburg]|uniref:AraC family transcriptional regulator n=1 Tax=Salmonella enterica subsp. enterica serovar Sandiego TaxID=1151002 RepID=A0A8E7NDW7_SALET|nr:AraC family transcriptional regulator [Salmonella enterica subsp. enterica serovar Oranienburg]EJD1399004.1 AraC family transcriptional regulator [Salmonella enterica]QVY04254.1 AraC family transcriptional regulator [Salmonella enterica subsp. enterica serovar Sandiego]EHN5831919.1 AraC family transcriptional regulator [Salmonella enterica subsp. enterica serovar Oranienburg]EJI9983129.1 AraC family transcriptional regulator [Salmonella enterica]
MFLYRCCLFLSTCSLFDAFFVNCPHEYADGEGVTAGELAELLSGFRLNNNDATETAQSGVRFFKITEHAERTPMVYDPGLYIIAQGQKIGYLGKDTFIYNEDNYLVNLVSIPFECETWGSKDVPLLGIYIEINIEQLFSIVDKMELRPVVSSGKTRGANRGMGPGRLLSVKLSTVH